MDQADRAREDESVVLFPLDQEMVTALGIDEGAAVAVTIEPGRVILERAEMRGGSS